VRVCNSLYTVYLLNQPPPSQQKHQKQQQAHHHISTMEEHQHDHHHKEDRKEDDNNEIDDDLQYLSGFGNTLQSECLPGALPIGRNNPRIVPYNLYTEQLTGTAFTAPRHENRRTWLYRIQPSVICIGGDAADDASNHSSNNENVKTTDEGNSATTAAPPKFFGQCDPSHCRTEVNPMRWKPMPKTSPSSSSSSSTSSTTTWVDGCRLMCHGGGPSGCATKQGLAIYVYACNRSMNDNNNKNNNNNNTMNTSMMYNADGDFLIVPQTGRLQVVTELGKLHIEPSEICVVPRGMVFQINLLSNSNNKNDDEAEQEQEEEARGYVLEIYNGSSFQLPQLGPIGSNGLASARDFLHPTACCSGFTSQQEYNHQSTARCEIFVKMNSQLSSKYSNHSPFNVVAWHGNYLPYKYDLKCFCAVNSVTYDHLDPSIYTVLTCPSETLAGTAVADFVIFPPRFMATDTNTFRPPWFHRNTMSEYMGLIYGKYDAKQDFQPGGATLHNCMIPHGPDAVTYHKAVADPCTAPTYFDGGLAFMFETCFPLQVSPQALLDTSWRDVNYPQCWQNLTANQFTGWKLLEERATASAAVNKRNRNRCSSNTDKK
jgi:homogentisate 1,2-dioxygenase